MKMATCFLNVARTCHTLLLRSVFKKGLIKTIDGIDKIYVCPESRNAHPPTRKLDLWRKLLQEVKEGDTVVDVGAYVGIFTILLAKRIGKTGKVLAFEPNPKNAALCKKNITLNKVSELVELFEIAIAEDTKSVVLAEERDTSHIISLATSNCTDCQTVKASSLDKILQNRKIDILKIDTEGYEAHVLSGAKKVLGRKEGSPRFIFIECHPYMWKGFGVTSEMIVTLLRDAGYLIELPEVPANKTLDNLEGHRFMFASKRT